MPVRDVTNVPYVLLIIRNIRFVIAVLTEVKSLQIVANLFSLSLYVLTVWILIAARTANQKRLILYVVEDSI